MYIIFKVTDAEDVAEILNFYVEVVHFEINQST